MVFRVGLMLLFFILFIFIGRRVVDGEDQNAGFYLEAFILGFFASIVVGLVVSEGTILWYRSGEPCGRKKIITPIESVQGVDGEYSFNIVHGDNVRTFSRIDFPDDKVIYGGKKSAIEEVVEVVPKTLWTEVVGVNGKIVRTIDFKLVLSDSESRGQ